MCAIRPRLRVEWIRGGESGWRRGCEDGRGGRQWRRTCGQILLLGQYLRMELEGGGRRKALGRWPDSGEVLGPELRGEGLED